MPWIESKVARTLERLRGTPIWLLAAVAFALLIIILVTFVVTLIGSTKDNIAVALGSLLGGMVGAGGAVWAVFLTLSRQRIEETNNVASALRTEVTALAKYVIGAIGICQRIA